ncbi:cytochrome P450 CYP72A219-like [Neltuma alba]|uniref:cytochrome P450 CYP72A219-like n=1 Tax=Neltuma alba TaxID=207710 RepID=UPI0010A537E0|nr:cytochrome P450 CYP72A219-like [Prosopis alba]
MATSFAFLVLFVMMKLVHISWWTPKSIERILRKQGMRGTSYRPFRGDKPEMEKSVKDSSSKPIALNAQVVPRVIPFYHDMVKRYGKVSVCWSGSIPRLIIGEAELIRLIFDDKKGGITQQPLNPLVKLLHKGLATLGGEKWSKRRRQITPAFHLDKLKGMVPAFSSSCYDLIERWQKKVEAQGWCEIDVAPELDALACDAISRTAFGCNYQEGKQLFELQKEQVSLAHEAYQSIYVPGLRFVPTRKNKRRYQLYDQIKGLLRNMIRQREDATKRGELGRGLDLLGLLLQCKEQSKNNDLTIEDVMEECKLFYFAGQETTATLLTWTMICLSMYPDWQEKARQEVLEICGTTKPNSGTISRLKIVSMILHEVLRLYPPVPILFRYTRRETNVGRLLIPAGAELCLSVMHAHYDTNYWGEDADQFKPERFSKGVSKASKDQVAFYAFGWGPRICLGQAFALIEAKITVATILQHFSFHLSPSYAHAPHLGINIKPQYGAPIILRRI